MRDKMIEEILYAADAFGIREEVINLSLDFRETNPRLTRVDSYELALRHLTGKINE